MLTPKTKVGMYLFARVLREGKDSRFDKMKDSPGAFFGAFIAQAVWVSLCQLPVMLLNGVPLSAFAGLPGLRASDVLGLSLFVGGFAFEVIADRQKARWMADKKAKKHDEDFITKGLWSRRYVSCRTSLAL
jgi:steroid 5-alpha reductase family enzyme